ncbi:GAF domain-containing protein [Streptomyces sp. NPDC051109]|uniref:GAF domain-containing protein n=1 Tax=Streptomyces sp. NPDC051109 TaxID=3365642 RepID=UPI001065A439
MNTREQQLAEAFVDLSDTLADDVDPLTLLDRLVRHCVDLTGTDAACVMLANARGSLRPAAATEERTVLTEILQSEAQRGSCVEAHTTGAPVRADALADHAERWPAFVAVARAAGYGGAHALPPRARQQTLGALNLLSGADRSPSAAGITPHEAFRRLHAHAAGRGRRPTGIAEQLVRRTIRPDEVLADASGNR